MYNLFKSRTFGFLTLLILFCIQKVQGQGVEPAPSAPNIGNTFEIMVEYLETGGKWYIREDGLVREF